MTVTKEDTSGFFDDSLANHPDYLQCTYFFETTTVPELAAAGLCSELSTAQWQRPGIDEDLRPEYAAKVVALKVLKISDMPLYPQITKAGSEFTQCHLQVAYPLCHFDDSLTGLLSALAGEGAFYAPGITCVRLMDIDGPETWLKKFGGPQFGLRGLRKTLNAFERPFFVGVIKPNLGMSPEPFAELAYQAFLGGLDIAKDDEMLMNPRYAPFEERIRLCAQASQNAADQTGRPHIMLANITAEHSDVLQHLNTAQKLGAQAVMVNPYFTGFSTLRSVKANSSLPLMGHFTGMALYDRMPHFGIDGVVLVKLQRLAGCDIIGLPGFGERMHNTEETVLKNVQACLQPWGPIAPSLPIPGGSDSAKTLPNLYQKIGHTDFALIAGRGVFSYPGGPREGAKSLWQAWEQIKK